MSEVLGLDAKLYYKEGGVGSANAWTELTNTKDVTLNLETGEADVTTRANNGWRATLATLKEGTVEFEMVWDTADAGFTVIKDAWLTNQVVGLSVLDGDIATGTGLQADFTITNFTRNEPLEEALTVAVTAKVARSATPPAWLDNGS